MYYILYSDTESSRFSFFCFFFLNNHINLWNRLLDLFLDYYFTGEKQVLKIRFAFHFSLLEQLFYRRTLVYVCVVHTVHGTRFLCLLHSTQVNHNRFTYAYGNKNNHFMSALTVHLKPYLKSENTINPKIKFMFLNENIMWCDVCFYGRIIHNILSPISIESIRASEHILQLSLFTIFLSGFICTNITFFCRTIFFSMIATR